MQVVLLASVLGSLILIAGCASSDRSVSALSTPAWVRDLNERPPERNRAQDVAQIKADLNGVREGAARRSD